MPSLSKISSRPWAKVDKFDLLLETFVLPVLKILQKRSFTHALAAIFVYVIFKLDYLVNLVSLHESKEEQFPMSLQKRYDCNLEVVPSK